jgi:hypothetical protein
MSAATFRAIADAASSADLALVRISGIAVSRSAKVFCEGVPF